MLVAALVVMVLLDASHWNLRWNQSMTGAGADEDRTCADIIYCPQEYMVRGDGAFYGGYIVSDEQVTVHSYEKDGLRIDMIYRAEPGGHWVELPLMHYMGYVVTDEKGEDYEVMTGDAGNMRVLLENSERHELHVRYRDPVLFRIASFISILTILIIILILLTRGFRGGPVTGPMRGVRHE